MSIRLDQSNSNTAKYKDLSFDNTIPIDLLHLLTLNHIYVTLNIYVSDNKRLLKPLDGGNKNILSTPELIEYLKEIGDKKIESMLNLNIKYLKMGY